VTRWIVDGMNVIGSRPTGWWRDRPGAMRTLTRELGELAGATGDELTVVFDGRPFELAAPAGVTVEFATRRGRNAADDDIAALVERDRDPAGLTVVTSDYELASRVRAAGADVLGAGEFRRRLDDSRGLAPRGPKQPARPAAQGEKSTRGAWPAAE
jgi:predicted RNA-binding protein with PIN domain